MTETGAPPPHAAAPGPAGDPWTTWGLIRTHKPVAIGVLVLVVVMLAGIGVGILGRSGAAVSDSTSCQGWSSASQSQEQAYARLYITEHRSLPNGATNPNSVVAAINAGCMQAFDADVEDSVTVLTAIRGH